MYLLCVFPRQEFYKQLGANGKEIAMLQWAPSFIDAHFLDYVHKSHGAPPHGFDARREF